MTWQEQEKTMFLLFFCRKREGDQTALTWATIQIVMNRSNDLSQILFLEMYNFIVIISVALCLLLG